MLITPPTAEPISLAEAKSQLGINDTDSDAQIARRITEARLWCESYLRRSLMPQTHELRLDVFADRIALPMPPVVAIESVKYIAGDGTLTTVDAADYVLDTSDYVPVLRLAYDAAWPSPRIESNAVRIRYTTGYDVSALAAAKTVTAITVAAPGVVSSTAHGFTVGQLLQAQTTGMIELDEGLYRVFSQDANTLQLGNLQNTAGLSTLDYSAFTSGTLQSVSVAVPELMIEAMIVLIGHWTNYQTRIEAGNFITRVPVAVEQLLEQYKIWAVLP